MHLFGCHTCIIVTDPDVLNFRAEMNDRCQLYTGKGWLSSARVIVCTHAVCLLPGLCSSAPISFPHEVNTAFQFLNFSKGNFVYLV